MNERIALRSESVLEKRQRTRTSTIENTVRVGTNGEGHESFDIVMAGEFLLLSLSVTRHIIVEVLFAVTIASNLELHRRNAGNSTFRRFRHRRPSTSVVQFRIEPKRGSERQVRPSPSSTVLRSNGNDRYQ